MDTVSYPQPEVEKFIADHLIPLRIPADHPQMGPQFTIKWTPTLIILDTEGKEHFRTLGFLAPEEFVPSLLLGLAKTSFDSADRTKSIKYLDRLISAYPGSFFAPEAVYLRGVSGYIESHDISNLIGICDTLKEKYPDSHWVMRAAPYELLRK